MTAKQPPTVTGSISIELREHADSFYGDVAHANPKACPDLYRRAADEIDRLTRPHMTAYAAAYAAAAYAAAAAAAAAAESYAEAYAEAAYAEAAYAKAAYAEAAKP